MVLCLALVAALVVASLVLILVVLAFHQSWPSEEAWETGGLVDLQSHFDLPHLEVSLVMVAMEMVRVASYLQYLQEGVKMETPFQEAHLDPFQPEAWEMGGVTSFFLDQASVGWIVWIALMAEIAELDWVVEVLEAEVVGEVVEMAEMD